MRGFLKPFAGFAPSDFEAYQPSKWSSNLYNLERMQVKQKVSALASSLESCVKSLDLELQHETSADRPSIWNQKRVDSQWLYYFRDSRAQRELLGIIDRARSMAENIDDPAHHHRHIILALRVDETGCSVLCGLHRSALLDRQNLQKKWADQYERPKLLNLFTSLSDKVDIVLGGERYPAASVDEGVLDTTFSRAAEVDGWIALESSYPPDDPTTQTESFASVVAEDLQHLAELYRLVAWSKRNDFISIAQQVAEEKKARRKHRNVPFQEDDWVQILGGLFAGQKGVVQGFDRAGKVKVRVGTVTLPVSAGSLKSIKR